MADVFVSYATEDRQRVKPLVDAIEKAGFSVWWDRGIGLGRSFDREIERELDAAGCVVVAWSANSTESDWVRNEAQEGMDRGVLIPLLIDSTKPPLAFRRVQTANLSSQLTNEELEPVLAAVSSCLRRPINPSDRATKPAAPQNPHEAETATGVRPFENLNDILVGKPSVVILPLRNLSGPPGRVLAEGLTYDITTRIGRTRSVMVTARGTAFKLGAGDHDVREVGQRLGVRYVCYGSIEIKARRLRVNVSVAATATREEIWAQTYEEKLDDIMLAQERIARQLVLAMQVEIDRLEQQRALLVPSENLDAWSAFHQGCWYMYQFRKEHVSNAERMFRRSIDLEPTVPRPYAGLSFIGFERVFLGLSRDRASDIRQAQDLALRALELDPRDPMGHWALSRTHLLAGDLTEAEAALSNAIRLNPSYAIAIYSLGWVYMHGGRNEACIEQIENARRLSPLDPLMFAMMGVQSLNMALMGRTQEAVEISRLAIQQPNIHARAYSFNALSHAIAGKWVEASRLMEHTWADDQNYDADAFFKDQPFQREQDIATIRDAFEQLEARRRR